MNPSSDIVATSTTAMTGLLVPRQDKTVSLCNS